MNDKLILSIDPGSVRTGWALMKPPEQLIKAGLLLPDKQTAPSEFRIDAMCRSLWTLLNYWQPKTIIIEWTSGKVGKKRHHGGGAGLAVHGAATGALYRECVAWLRWQPPQNQLETKVQVVRENVWTRQVPKADRQAAIAQMFPAYSIKEDPGGDIADAIGLAIWYQREQTVRLVKCLT